MWVILTENCEFWLFPHTAQWGHGVQPERRAVDDKLSHGDLCYLKQARYRYFRYFFSYACVLNILLIFIPNCHFTHTNLLLGAALFCHQLIKHSAVIFIDLLHFIDVAGHLLHGPQRICKNEDFPCCCIDQWKTTKTNIYLALGDRECMWYLWDGSAPHSQGLWATQALSAAVDIWGPSAQAWWGRIPA